ncbi:MAG: hypothetical protein K6C08_14540 [Oscillospiraceae bacterium]|nr:hypothetical protein [Oscillospiraceae bacterium]
MRIIRVLTALLGLSLTLGLCACSDKNAETPPTEATAEEKLILRYHLATADIAVENEAVLFQQGEDGAFLALINRKTGERIPDEAKEDPEFVNDGNYDVYESALFQVSAGGKRSKIRRYRTLPAPEGPADDASYRSEMRPRAFRTLEDGRILALESSYECWQDESRIPSFQTRDRSYIRVLSENGTEISCSEILPGRDIGNLDIGNLVCLGGDLFAVPAEQNILFFDKEGTEHFSVTAPLPVRELIEYGEKLAVVLGQEEHRWLSLIDPNRRSVTVPQELPADAHEFCEGNDGRLYFIRNSEIFAYEPDTAESVRMLSFLEAGIDPATVGAMYTGSDGSFYFLLHEWQENEEVKEVHAMLSPEMVPDDGLTLRLGFSEISGGLKQALVSWIRSGENSVRLEVLDLNNGSGTYDNVDVMILGEDAWRIRDEAGLLADLEPLLGDEADTFFPSVLRALRGTSGKLSRLSGRFYIESMACDSDTVMGSSTLSMSALRTIFAEMPAGSSLYEPYYCYDRLLEALLAVNRAGQEDAGADEATDSALKAFAALQPQTYDYRHYAADTSSMEARIYEGRLLLLQAHIGSLEELKAYDDFFYSGACFAGWPTETSSFSRFCFDECLAVSADCSADKKEVVLQLLQLLLSEQYSESGYGFPVQQEKLEEWMTEDAENIIYEVDEEGEFILDKKKEKVEAARSVWYSAEWRKHSVYALTAAQREKLLNLINSCV